MHLTAAGQSHAGCVSERNEDAFLIHETPTLLAIADGMGGHDDGDFASALLINELRLTTGETSEALAADVKARIVHVNRMLLDEAQAGHTIGSTLVCVIAAQDGAFVLWVGDSRAYLLRGRTLTPLTTDHSVVQDMIHAGTLTLEEARRHPLSNRITRAVGIADDIKIDHHTMALFEDDRLILCSDGLTDCLTDDEIAATLRFRDDTGACGALVAAAVARGAPDNVTVICATVSV